MKSSVCFYVCDDLYICVKKIDNRIVFIDKETDGLNFSWSIEENYSKKNIERFLLNKFTNIHIWK